MLPLPLTLRDIYIYPVKSLAGFCVDSWKVNATGLRYDRQWMIVDEQFRFMTQREEPRMALIQTRLTTQKLFLSSAEQEEISLPLNPPQQPECQVTVWQDTILAQRVTSADAWLSDILKRPCHLVYLPDHSIRSVDPNYAKPNDRVGFADGFPFLVISAASLQNFNQLSGLNLSMSRFRPNLVIDSAEPFAEDLWRRIRINQIEFVLPKPCSRCNIPAINPITAKSEPQVLKKLKQIRQAQQKTYFGQNAIHQSSGTLKIGSAVEILATGPQQPEFSKAK